MSVKVMINEMITDSSFDHWTATCATGINDSGQIVGSAENDDTGETRGFMFDPQSPRCVLLPKPLNGPGQTAEKINNLGDIVAAEEGGWKTQYTWDADEGYVVVGSWQKDSGISAFNDCGQILLNNGFRYTPDTGWERVRASRGDGDYRHPEAGTPERLAQRVREVLRTLISEDETPMSSAQRAE